MGPTNVTKKDIPEHPNRNTLHAPIMGGCYTRPTPMLTLSPTMNHSSADGFLSSWTGFTTQMVEAGARQEDLEEAYLLEVLDDVSPGKILEAFDMLPIPDIIRAVLPSRGQLMVALDGSDHTHKSALMACSTWMSQDPKDYEKLVEDVTLLQGLRPKKKLKLTRLRKWHVQSNGTVSIMDMETFSKRFQNLIDELL